MGQGDWKKEPWPNGNASLARKNDDGNIDVLSVKAYNWIEDGGSLISDLWKPIKIQLSWDMYHATINPQGQFLSLKWPSIKAGPIEVLEHRLKTVFKMEKELHTFLAWAATRPIDCPLAEGAEPA
jgi:hypothetical protein